jgi:Pyridoxine 5'-phosphate oxidase C-terminal dimerisation region
MGEKWLKLQGLFLIFTFDTGVVAQTVEFWQTGHHTLHDRVLYVLERINGRSKFCRLDDRCRQVIY